MCKRCLRSTRRAAQVRPHGASAPSRVLTRDALARAMPAQGSKSFAWTATPVRLRRSGLNARPVRALTLAPSRTDMGSGKFAQQLTFPEWLAFNNAQRGHQNMLETLPTVYATLFGAGIFHPKLASWCALCRALRRTTRLWLLTVAQVRRVFHRRPAVVQVGLRAEGAKGAPNWRCGRGGRHHRPHVHLHVHGVPAGAAAEALCVIYNCVIVTCTRGCGPARLTCAQPAFPRAAPSWRQSTGKRLPRP